MLHAALVTPLSGELGGYGRAGAVALDLWTAWHNRHYSPKIELSVFDAGPDLLGALARAEEMPAALLFGSYGSGPMTAMAAATSRLVWNHGGARVPAAPNIVTVLAPADTYFHGAVRVTRQADPGVQSVCVLSGDTGFGRAVAGGAVREARRGGLRVIEGRLNTAARPAAAHQADLLLAAGRFGQEIAAARRLLPQRRWRAAGFVGAGVQEVLAELGSQREGLVGPAQWLAETAPSPDEGPSAAEFVAAYRYRTGSDPPYPAAQAFAAGVIATRCLREAGSAEDTALAAAARTLQCTTMFAPFRLDPKTREQVGHRMLTVQWQDGVRRVIWPPEQAQACLRYPLPAGPDSPERS